MTAQRDPDAILAAWLEEGPTGSPTTTRRAIAVGHSNHPQARRPMWVPWRVPTMNGTSRLALARWPSSPSSSAGSSSSTRDRDRRRRRRLRSPSPAPPRRPSPPAVTRRRPPSPTPRVGDRDRCQCRSTSTRIVRDPAVRLSRCRSRTAGPANLTADEIGMQSSAAGAIRPSRADDVVADRMSASTTGSVTSTLGISAELVDDSQACRPARRAPTMPLIGSRRPDLVLRDPTARSRGSTATARHGDRAARSLPSSRPYDRRRSCVHVDGSACMLDRLRDDDPLDPRRPTLRAQSDEVHGLDPLDDRRPQSGNASGPRSRARGPRRGRPRPGATNTGSGRPRAPPPAS